MSIKLLPDAGGSTLKVLDLQGRLYPTFDLESLKGAATFKARPDDVVVCAYPKSGTHWVWEIIRFLLAGTTDLPLIEKDDAMIEDVLPSALESQASPRPLNTHYHFECLSPELFAKKVKLVYVTRDPRDVSVSFYNHHKKLVQYYDYQGDWKNYLPMFMDGRVDYESWFAYTKGWENGMKANPDHPILVTSYEALHQDSFREVQKIARFIGVDQDDKFMKEVVQKCSFAVMRNTKGKNETFENASSPVMYRKGKVGDWKNWYTVAQSEQFNVVFEEEMRGTDAYQLYSHTVQTQADANMNSK